MKLDFMILGISVWRFDDGSSSTFIAIKPRVLPMKNEYLVFRDVKL
jgi:hypothetical protein